VSDWWPESAGPGPHSASSPEQYRAAETAFNLVGAYWVALGADDDETIRAVLLPETLARFVDVQSGPAQRVREFLGLSIEQCRGIGCSNVVRFDGNGAFLVLSMEPRGFGIELIDEPQLRRVWPMVVVPFGDGWRIRGITDASTGPATVGLIDIVPASDRPAS
jgi:hypothetical protein